LKGTTSLRKGDEECGGLEEDMKGWHAPNHNRQKSKKLNREIEVIALAWMKSKIDKPSWLKRKKALPLFERAVPIQHIYIAYWKPNK